ncbi:hypothetical protein KLP28_00085 [Nocardioidaceae bacterium]|nr:hypothetical protein KLP28_00085 [Nocardioidaceae bacterium]
MPRAHRRAHRREHRRAHRREHRRRALLAGALLAPMLLASCASEEERYCDALGEAAPRIESLGRQAGSSPAASALASLPVLEEVSAEAPPELVDEWTVVLNALRTFRDSVRAADVETGPGAAEAIEALPPEERDAVQQAAARLAAPQVIEASAGIEDYGTQVCGVSLGA